MIKPKNTKFEKKKKKCCTSKNKVCHTTIETTFFYIYEEFPGPHFVGPN